MGTALKCWFFFWGFFVFFFFFFLGFFLFGLFWLCFVFCVLVGGGGCGLVVDPAENTGLAEHSCPPSPSPPLMVTSPICRCMLPLGAILLPAMVDLFLR